MNLDRFWGVIGLLVGLLSIYKLYPDITGKLVPPLAWTCFVLRGLQVALIGIWMLFIRQQVEIPHISERMSQALSAITIILMIPACAILLVDSDLWGSKWYYSALFLSFLQIIWVSRRGHIRLATVLLIHLLILQLYGMSALHADLAFDSRILTYSLVILLSGLMIRWWSGLVMAFVLPVLTYAFSAWGLIDLAPDWGEAAIFVLSLGAQGAIAALYQRALERALKTADQRTVELQASQDALFKEKERAEVTLHSIGDAVITTDASGMVEFLNPVAETLTGWTNSEATGQAVKRVFAILDEEKRAPAEDLVWHCLRDTQAGRLASSAILARRDGREFYIDQTVSPIRNRAGEMIGAVLVFHDSTEARRAVQKMAYDATHDMLTGLINRREFEARLDRAIASAYNEGEQHTLCFMDLDRFKVVNDTAGHAAGDALLKSITRLLSGMFRHNDTLARLGGDEFGLLLENCPLEYAQIIAARIIVQVRDFQFCSNGQIFPIGISIGMVPITAETESLEILLKHADAACYQAKEEGRGRYCVYEKTLP
jgi:diguanylate cyclase (GGDEF)-like protein/PAS domain S-box-containing protein